MIISTLLCTIKIMSFKQQDVIVQLMLSYIGKCNLTNDPNYFLTRDRLVCSFQPLI